MIKFHAYKMLQTSDGPLPFDVALNIENGEFLSIYGNSGAGKTTLLRIFAGLTDTENSFIEVENEVWDNTDKKYHIPVQKRSIGFVFQDFALFPNLSVRENLEYALQKGATGNIIDELLELIELESLQKSKPAHLSGGQKQRVALARAIVRQPSILLLDEPLSALDDEMRIKLQDYILKVHKRFGLTTLLVSHHLPEIFRLSDKVIVIDKGKIIKEGSPEAVFLEDKFSNNLKITGEIMEIKKNDVITAVSILTGSEIIKVLAGNGESDELRIGQKALVTIKDLNPFIRVIE